MNMNESVTMNGSIIVKDTNNIDIVVMYLNATINTENMSININANTANKELVIANAETVKTQYTEFETAVKARATQLGYVIF